MTSEWSIAWLQATEFQRRVASVETCFRQRSPAMSVLLGVGQGVDRSLRPGLDGNLHSKPRILVVRTTDLFRCKDCHEGWAQETDPGLRGASATTPMGCHPTVCRIFPTAAACHSPAQWRRNFAVQFVRNSRNRELGKLVRCLV